MEYDIDEIKRVICIKCTEEEKPKIEKEITLYCPDGYELNFTIETQTTN